MITYVMIIYVNGRGLTKILTIKCVYYQDRTEARQEGGIRQGGKI